MTGLDEPLRWPSFPWQPDMVGGLDHSPFFFCGEFTVPRPTAFYPTSHLTVADMQIKTSPEDEEYVALRLKTSKTDQFRRGHVLYAGHSNHRICPVCTLSQLIDLDNKTNASMDSVPLFASDERSALSRPVLLRSSNLHVSAIATHWAWPLDLWRPQLSRRRGHLGSKCRPEWLKLKHLAAGHQTVIIDTFVLPFPTYYHLSSKIAESGD